MQTPPEKLGSFYLGAEYDLTNKARLELPVSYDARDLTTHGVCVGMTDRCRSSAFSLAAAARVWSAAP